MTKQQLSIIELRQFIKDKSKYLEAYEIMRNIFSYGSNSKFFEIIKNYPELTLEKQKDDYFVKRENLRFLYYTPHNSMFSLRLNNAVYIEHDNILVYFNTYNQTFKIYDKCIS